MAMSNMYDNKGFGTPNAINSMAENPMAKKAQGKGSSLPVENIAGLHERLRSLPDYALAKMIGSGQPQGLEAMLAMLVAGDRANMRQSTVQAPPPGEKTMAEQAIASLGGGAPQIPGGGITESIQAPAQAPAQAQAAPVMAAQGGLIRLQGGGPVFGSGTTREDKLTEEEEELARRIASTSMTEEDINSLNVLNQRSKHKSDWIYNKAQDIQRNDPVAQVKRAIASTTRPADNPAHYIDLAGMGLEAIGATDMGKKQRRRIGEDLWKSAKQGVSKVGEGLMSLEGSLYNEAAGNARINKLANERYRKILEGERAGLNLTKEQLDAKFDQAGPQPPTNLERLSGWLGGISDKYTTKKPPVPTDKPDTKETPNPLLDNLKNQIAQKAPEKSFIEQALGPDFQQKLLGLSALSKHTSPYGKSMEAQKESQRKLQGTQATARAAGRTDQWKAHMQAQTSLQNNLLKAKQDLAQITDTGRPKAEQALKDQIAQMERALLESARYTGVSGALGRGPVSQFRQLSAT